MTITTVHHNPSKIELLEHKDREMQQEIVNLKDKISVLQKRFERVERNIENIEQGTPKVRR